MSNSSSENPAERLAAALADRYHIERELGAGGMAVVYLAQDLKHDRHVALKVLKPELAAVLGADRFLSEIKTTANLQHPHILPLYDSGEADSFLYYVMPYVEGESLRERLAREKQLSVEEALRIAKAVGSALDFAHRKGVVHRDIKPANILLQDGQPLVADFGIALAVVQAGGGRLTETGLSLGTPHYMSPEQATADRDPDARSDIYSLACVVYEMLTGEPPHLGGSAQAVLARILTEPPRPVRDGRPTVPVHVEAALAKALQKLPADRFDTTADFIAALEGRVVVEPTGGVGVTSRGPGSRGPRHPWLWPAAAVGALAVGALAGWLARVPKPVPPPVVRLYVQGDSTFWVTNMCCGPSLAISQNGRHLAFMAQTDSGRVLYVRDLGDAVAHRVTGTKDAHTPFLDPSGRWLGFVKSGALMKTDLSGGSPQVIARLGTSRIWGATWGDDGFIYFTRFPGGAQAPAPGIYRVSAQGGKPVLVSAPDTAVEANRVNPAALPGGRGLLYVSWPKQGRDSAAWVAVLDLKDGSTHRLTRGIQPYYASGHLVYARADGSIMARPFDLASLKLTGDAVRIGSNALTHNASDTEYAVSRSGTLISRRATGTHGAASQGHRFYSLAGALLQSGVSKLPWGMPTYSPDGRRLAFMRLADTQGNDIQLWVRDLDTGLDTRLSPRHGYAVAPVWSADGRDVRWIEYEKSGTGRLESRAADLSAPATRFAPELSLRLPAQGSSGADRLGLPSRSGGPIPFTVPDTTGNGDDLWIMNADGTHPRPFLQSSANEKEGAISPSGKWIAYVSDETGEDEVWVEPFPRGGPHYRISESGGDYPVWASDSRLLFLNQNAVVLASLAVSGGRIRASGYRTVVSPVSTYFGFRPFDVSPDGKTVVVIGTNGSGRILVETDRIEQLGRGGR